MTPIGIQRPGALHTSPNKGSAIQPAINAARGGASNSMQDYTKATPMAQPQAPDDMGDGGGGFGMANGGL
jgi:hypothetical protein